jgi:hypothetical protein
LMLVNTNQAARVRKTLEATGSMSAPTSERTWPADLRQGLMRR